MGAGILEMSQRNTPATRVGRVINEESGLVADPVDLISLKISANVNNKGSKTASNEHELANQVLNDFIVAPLGEDT